MTNVWFCETGDNVAFTNKSHLIPALQISFGSCTNVQITPVPQDDNRSGTLQFRVTGRRRDDTADFDETHTFTMVQVYDEPVHL